MMIPIIKGMLLAEVWLEFACPFDAAVVDTIVAVAIVVKVVVVD